MAARCGNLIDRAIRGRVIDFMRAHYYDLNYPIFNVADSAISIGVVLILLTTIFGRDHESQPSLSVNLLNDRRGAFDGSGAAGLASQNRSLDRRRA